MSLSRALPAGGWQVEEVWGTAAELHASSGTLVQGGPALPDHPGGTARLVRVLHASRPAVVLGAGQPDEVVDRGRAARLGLEVARRRSGGAAVLVGPGESVWVDLVIPAGDPLWDDDVGVSMAWVGEAWAGALARLGGPSPRVWRGGLSRTRWSDRVCFAGVGPGEVLAAPCPAVEDPPPAAPGPPADRPGPAGWGPKVVGVSQRRTRGGALFQTAALLRWRPLDLLDALALDPGERRRAAGELVEVAAGLGAVSPGEVVDAFLESLSCLAVPGEDCGRARLP